MPQCMYCAKHLQTRKSLQRHCEALHHGKRIFGVHPPVKAFLTFFTNLSEQTLSCPIPSCPFTKYRCKNTKLLAKHFTSSHPHFELVIEHHCQPCGNYIDHAERMVHNRAHVVSHVTKTPVKQPLPTINEHDGSLDFLYPASPTLTCPNPPTGPSTSDTVRLAPTPPYQLPCHRKSQLFNTSKTPTTASSQSSLPSLTSTPSFLSPHSSPPDASQPLFQSNSTTTAPRSSLLPTPDSTYFPSTSPTTPTFHSPNSQGDAALPTTCSPTDTVHPLLNNLAAEQSSTGPLSPCVSLSPPESPLNSLMSTTTYPLDATIVPDKVCVSDIASLSPNHSVDLISSLPAPVEVVDVSDSMDCERTMALRRLREALFPSQLKPDDSDNPLAKTSPPQISCSPLVPSADTRCVSIHHDRVLSPSPCDVHIRVLNEADSSTSSNNDERRVVPSTDIRNVTVADRKHIAAELNVKLARLRATLEHDGESMSPVSSFTRTPQFFSQSDDSNDNLVALRGSTDSSSDQNPTRSSPTISSLHRDADFVTAPPETRLRNVLGKSKKKVSFTQQLSETIQTIRRAPLKSATGSSTFEAHNSTQPPNDEDIWINGDPWHDPQNIDIESNCDEQSSDNEAIPSAQPRPQRKPDSPPPQQIPCQSPTSSDSDDANPNAVLDDSQELPLESEDMERLKSFRVKWHNIFTADSDWQSFPAM